MLKNGDTTYQQSRGLISEAGQSLQHLGKHVREDLPTGNCRVTCHDVILSVYRRDTDMRLLCCFFTVGCSKVSCLIKSSLLNHSVQYNTASPKQVPYVRNIFTGIRNLEFEFMLERKYGDFLRALN